MYTFPTFVQTRVFFKHSRKLRYFRTAHLLLLWTASEEFLLLLLESIYHNVFNYTNIINGFERKDPSVRFSATMTNIYLTLKQTFGKPIRFLPQVKIR
jgi:hypothetical protein